MLPVPSRLLLVVLTLIAAGCVESASGSTPDGAPAQGSDGGPASSDDASAADSGSGDDLVLPADAFVPGTWGYVGCSNTHDTVWGYHHVATADLFWPFEGYPIEGQTVPEWVDPASAPWDLFDQMVREHNGGDDPPVIWIQMCLNLDPDEPNYGTATYDDVAQVIENVRARAPSSFLFVSPLQDYDPIDLCPKMGPGGMEIPQMIEWLDAAVAAGLAHAGPGVGGNQNLGPLTEALTVEDHCHPTGGPHGPGGGADLLGGQLSGFFDDLPRE